uniref:Piwi domain-containing protein n=1 Tax=Panagrolaimus davidi TaxID=227884 RepID=A0A914PPQ7_9BILA
MVKISAQPPAVQKNEVRSFLGALGLNKLNKERDGIQMRSHLTITGRILQNPDIVYADDKQVIPADDGLWKLPGKYLRGGETSQWGLIRYGNAIDVNMRAFQNSYVGMCKKNGVQIPEIPILIGKVDNRGLEYFFDEAKKKKVEFLVIISDLNIDMQGELKCLERKYEVATQNITAKVANDAATRGTATLENIVHKTNPKLGGTNYTISHRQKFVNDAFGKNCLIIGVALSHSGSIDDVQRARGGVAASTLLSAVGYAANTGLDPYEFIGDHLPNNPHRSEILDLIPGIIESTITKFNENRKMFPSSMLLYLNGSSEGDFILLKRFEVPLVFKKMKEKIGREIPLTVIIPQRSNVARIYKTNPSIADKPSKQNIQPGVVVDTGLVHPKINEFFLNSHTTIQGTARTPKYTVLYNNNENVSMDAIQHITYYLCFGHQIVQSPTSLPSPVYVASAYAERGTKMYKAMHKVGGNSDPEEIVEFWIYDTSAFFRNKRINA